MYKRQAHTYTSSDGTGYFRGRMCRRKKYDVIACICSVSYTHLSTTVMTVIGDILVVETMKKTGFTIEEYSKRHHGGYLLSLIHICADSLFTFQ